VVPFLAQAEATDRDSECWWLVATRNASEQEREAERGSRRGPRFGNGFGPVACELGAPGLRTESPPYMQFLTWRSRCRPSAVPPTSLARRSGGPNGGRPASVLAVGAKINVARAGGREHPAAAAQGLSIYGSHCPPISSRG
jgi:hypothetical protein